MTSTLLSLLSLAAWAFLWIAGGWLILLGAFRIPPAERIPLAVMVGLVVDVLFANMLGQVLPVPLAFWLAAALVLILGMALAWGQKLRDVLRLPFRPAQVLVLLGLTVIFTLTERGMPMFDDYAHLPTLSLIATGDIPPHFALNAPVPYAYHYFLMLFAAQISRIAGLNIWTSLDAARAIAFSITVVLAALWARRLTRRFSAMVLGGLFAALGMGTRWLLLLLPKQANELISPHIQLLGSATAYSKNFADALWYPWGVEGVEPVKFPFAFANGIYAPGVVSISGPNSIVAVGITFLLLLTFNRWRGWRGAVVTTLAIASTALLYEVEILLSIAGWGLVALLVMLKNRSIRLPALLWQWLAVIGAGTLLGAFQGGAFTDILVTYVRQMQGQTVVSYQTVGFLFSLSPAIVSAHLGVLWFRDPVQMFVALLEIGPVILVLPLLAAWGIKAFRAGRWYEAALILSGFLSLGLVFVQFTGSPGVRNTSRLYSFVWISAAYAVPLVYLWVERRSERLKWVAGALAAAAMFGGLVLLSVKLVAGQNPVYSSFLTELDAHVYDEYWNQLEPEAVVFDPDPYRGTTVFGRPTLGYSTWFDPTPELLAFKANPSPPALRAVGFTHVYLDNFYTNALPLEIRQQYQGSCPILLDEYEDWQGNTRRLYDIRDCN